jgi:hypothetical protein
VGWWLHVDERVGDFVAGVGARGGRGGALWPVDGLFVTGLGRLLFPPGGMPGARRLKQADALLCVSHPQ